MEEITVREFIAQPFESEDFKTNSLYIVLSEFISKDLTQRERSILQKFWFEKKGISGIAADFGLNRSTVSRALGRAQRKIHEGLKYVLLYKHLEDEERKRREAV